LCAIEIYAIFGGADFGGGVWDLFASGPRKEEQRRAIALAMGPVWETNHVWLIYSIVLLFTCFPGVFADLSIGLYVPLTLVLVGVLCRGAAFAFRAHAYRAAHTSRAWGRVFGVASTLTPLMFGACAGAVAQGSYAWLSPFAAGIGILALCTSAQLAAVFLALETDEPALQDDFRRRALGTTVVLAAVGAIDLALARFCAPAVFATLLKPQALFCVGVAMLVGLALLVSLWTRRLHAARVLVAVETTAILAGWYAGQAPYLIAGHATIYSAAGPSATLAAFLWISAIGALFLIPSLWLLFAIFKGRNPAALDA
jgi:cytochrome d ubiquinol oxidase subunit II